ncbi:MAG TPA: multicopper oxidase domain-containing protein [Solirubrobacteraceae bacterium]|nr:multicopper oxidase domain-containing protein [Solirubrobacteraceae bacterium]
MPLPSDRSPRVGRAPRLLPTLIESLVLAYAVGAALHFVHSGQHEAHEVAPVLHWLRDSSLAVPGAIATVWLVARLAGRILAWAGVSQRSALGELSQALLGSAAYALACVPGSVAHGSAFGAQHSGMGFVEHLGFEASVVGISSFAVLVGLAGLRRLPAHAIALVRSARAATNPRWVAVTASVAPVGVAMAVAGPGALVGVQSAIGDSGLCPTGARQITYEVSAFQNVIPLNGWGDHIPDGLIYALRNPDARVGKQQMTANPNLTQPLVVRANVGDCVTVKLRNDIGDRRVGMHVDGLVRHDPKDSDGARIGNNPDTTVAENEEISYTWYADREGEAPLVDAANVDSAQQAHSSIQRGLYGAVVVHPKGSTWHNPTTGDDLLSGGLAVETQVFADVRVPDGKDYRSYAMVFMDENEDVKDRNGQQPTFPTTGLADSTFGINYRSEPLRNRLRAILEHRGTKTPENPDGVKKTVTLPSGRVIKPEDHFCDGYVPELDKIVEDPGAKCMSEESHLQSWIFGDEGKLTREVDGKIVTDTDSLIPKAYKGDPVKFHVIHPGARETHPWHQHTQRWFADPKNTKSSRNDVQSVGPGESRELDIEGGAGSVTGTIGDSIFHCHLYPHFAQGFWGHLRIYDRTRDGSQKYPDGTELEALRELPDRAGQTPGTDAAHPGFPLFVKGDLGQRAYRPPHGVIKDDFAGIRRPGDAPREPTAIERDNLPALDKTKPGAGYVDPCPAGAPTRTYKPHAIDAPITYNSAGWKDPEARMYVEEGQADAVRSGQKAPEPYTIRARVGECVLLQTTNDLHKDDDPNVPVDHLNKKDGVFMHETQTTEVSTHVHLVKFDQLASDGTSVGWNYVQAALPGQTYGYRWFVDQPLRTIFFHDHQYANLHQQKGLFAAMNVEPKDATWHDPKTGAATDGTGTVADIRTASGPDFREFTVFHQDRAPMWRADGRPVQPPGEPDDYGEDQGGYAFNYRNEPFQIRSSPTKPAPKNDPAYIYSSAVHGDPSTPVFRAYEKDPVVVRNVVGSHEEVHTFNVHGHRWLAEPDNPKSEQTDSQTLSLAEFANYEFQGSGMVKLDRTTQETLGWAMNGSENGVPNLIAGGAGRPGDYLYGSQPLDDQWLGLWGLFRVPKGTVSDLKPLPDRPAPLASASPWPALKPGAAVAPPPTTGEVTPCPSTAFVRSYDVVAMRHKIVYNKKTGDNDPNGLMYVLAADEAAVKAGTKDPEPLFIRANAGDCVKLKLTNKLPTGGLPDHDGDVPLPVDAPFGKSARVSIHPSLTKYDVTRSDGATVGYNYDQTIAPGASRTYTWYVEPQTEGATTNLVDFGDRRGHRHHGLWGALLIEPKGSTWTDPKTGLAVRSGAAADIKWTDASGVKRAYREFVADFQDGLNLRDKDGARIPEADEVDDPYELGNRGINYRTERFAPRLASNAEPAWVMSSKVHGDPATPVFEAYVGDPVRFRLLMGGDRGRGHSFVMHGHGWPNQPTDPASMTRTNRGGVLAGNAFVFDLVGGAGGLQKQSGDYLFRDGNLVNQVNAGLWGLLRAHGAPQPNLKPLG